MRLEESGDEGVIVLSSIHDDPRYCDSEYWPDVGARIRVRRYICHLSGRRHRTC